MLNYLRISRKGVSNYKVMAYTLDKESLRQFGVPEKFERLFGNVFKGEDGKLKDWDFVTFVFNNGRYEKKS